LLPFILAGRRDLRKNYCRSATPAEITIKTVRAAASAIGQQNEIFYASTDHEIDTIFADFGQKHDEALFDQVIQ
jgi:hypothetical protein